MISILDFLLDLGHSAPARFPSRPPLPVKNNRGMTLIEVMIVIVILGMIVAGGVSRLGGRNRTLKKSVRQISVLSRDLHNKAKLFGKTYRIVFDMNAEEGHSFWVESAEGKVTLLSEEKERELEKLTKIQRESLMKKNAFTMDTSITKKPVKMPEPLYFKEIEYGKRPDPISDGKTFVHFFPSGLVEEVAIHITDGEQLNWTIAFNPITGKADVFTKDIALKDLRQQ